jgi:two-component system, NtrC family, sensor kinase
VDPLSKANILVLDDDYPNLRLYQQLLIQAGYSVTATVNPFEAIQYLENDNYELILTDIRMPGMDGFELAARVRKLDPNIAIVLITGYGTADTAVQALKWGVDGLLLKPLRTVEDLTTTVRRVLEDRNNKRDADRLKALRPLFDITERLFTEKSPQALNNMLMEIAKDLFEAVPAGIYLNVDENKNWECIAGEDLRSFVTIGETAFGSFFEKMFANNFRIISNEQIDDKYFTQWLNEKEWRGIFVPVIHTNSRYIVYGFRPNQLGKIRGPDEEMLAILARQAAVALENARLYASLSDSLLRIEETQKALALAEKMAALGRLLGSLAHEINNPLQAVKNCLHLAGRKDLPSDQKELYQQMAIKEVERLSNLVHKTLEYNRPNELERRKINLVNIVDDVLNLIKHQLEQKNVHVIREFAEKSIIAEVFPDQIQQVFLNLLINAIDSMEGIENESLIWIALEEKEDKIEISIEDNGLGVPTGLEEQVFEPFFSTKPHGTGQGLAICYLLIVDIHKGEIQFVKPVHESGARIKITLPGNG